MINLDRINKIKHMGFNPDVVWYHGTPHDFEKFDYNTIGIGEDAHGPGFYFTNNPDTANQYTTNINSGKSPVVYPVHLKLTKGMNDNTKFSINQIKKIIQSAPELTDHLLNFGDVERQGISKVLNDAASIYQYHTGKDLLNVLRGDFFRNHSKEFMQAVTKHTGYDHYNCNSDYLDSNPHEKWVVAFHPHQIRSIHAEYNPDKMDSGNLLEEKLNNKKKPISKKTFTETLVSTIRKKRGNNGRTEIKINGKSTIIVNPHVRDITTEYNNK